jgi:hypothetical protein
MHKIAHWTEMPDCEHFECITEFYDLYIMNDL